MTTTLPVLVVGATGSLGGKVVDELLKRGKNVRALVRPTTDAGKLESVLAAGEPNRIKQAFRRYRRQVGERFYRVDVELKRTCDDLRQIVGPLASVLRMIA